MIAVTDLTKSFGRFRALDQVSLNVQKGTSTVSLAPMAQENPR